MSNLRINKTTETVKLIKSLIDPVTVYSLLGLNMYSQTSEEIRSKCPFHQGKNPTSFRFKKQTGNWICFSNGCHEGAGDIIGLVMKRLDLSFSEAISYLANIVGIDLEEENFGLDKEKIHQMVQETDIKGFITSKNAEHVHRDYYKERYLESFWHQMWAFDNSTFFTREGFSKEVLDYMEVKGTYIDYAGVPRISIPIRNNEGEFITLIGRRIDNNEDPRYLPFFKGFDKRYILYNYWQAKNFIPVFEGRLFVVEGFKGCWRMVESGLYNTVACMGTTITEEQAKAIYKNLSIKEIILVLDGDKAGRKGIPRALNTLGTASRIYPVYLPFKTDPSMYSPNDLLDILSKQKNSFLVNLTNKLKGEQKYERTK